MRLITRKIWRAFPELDRYSDEQCQRFVRAAQRRWLVRIRHWLTISIVSAGLLALAIAASTLIPAMLDRSSYNPSVSFIGAAIAVTTMLVSLSSVPVGGYVTRDWLLRRRIRYILRTRGICASCHYKLIGLPVGSENVVTCPECGLISHVDPSLGELVADDAGRMRFEPSADSLPKPPRIFTPRRIRVLKRTTLITLLVLAVAVPLGWFLYEMFLSNQAALARRERPGAAGLMTYIEEGQPADVPVDSPDAWEAFAAARATLEVIDAAEWRGKTLTTVGGHQYYPDFTHIYYPEPAADARAQEIADASRTLALELLTRYRESGVFDDLHDMASRRRAVRPLSLGPNQPAIAMLMPELGKCRNFARINRARMSLACESGDLEEYTDALEANFALSRMCKHQATVIDGLVGIAIEALTYSGVREALRMHPEEDWLNAIDAVIVRQRSSVPRARLFEGERLCSVDTTAWLFADVSNVRWGRFSAMVRQMAEGSDEVTFGRIGTYRENRDRINEFFDAVAAHGERERWERAGVATPGPDADDTVLLRILLPSVGKAMNSADQVELDRRGHIVMSALERHRLRHGAYPESLASLVPEFVNALPPDPWSGKPFGYVRVEPATDPQGRGYLLYSVSADGVDNGGVTRSAEPDFSGLWADPALAGPYDFVLNDAAR